MPKPAFNFPVTAILWTTARWAWPLPFVALAFRYLRRLPPDPAAEPEPLWEKRPLGFRLEPLDKVSLGILAALWFLVWLGRNTIFPIPPDSYYHLLVARHVYETGTIPLWNSWEWAPLGRPHLYPPLYHVLLALGAVPFHGDLLKAFRNVQPLVLPFAYFTTWYLARWLFDARRAFMALLITGMDLVLVFTAVMGTPGVLATSLVSILVVFFLSGRWLGAAVVLTLALYTHSGIPLLAIVGLGLFSLLNRVYLSRFLAVVTIAVLAALPWFARIYVFRDWFHHPIDLGIYGDFGPWMKPLMKIAWLQMVNLFIVAMAGLAVFRTRWREQRNQVMLCLLLSFLPMLISYGGRYYIHTVHLWAMLAAGLFTGWLARPLRWKRAGVLALLALCPAPALTGTGTPILPGAYPVPSAWLLSPAVALGGLRLLDGGHALGYVSFDNCREVAARIDAETDPGQILYFTWDRDLGLAIAFLADRRIDVGAWEETMPGEEIRNLDRWYGIQDPTACYIAQRRYGMLHNMQTERIGDVVIAVRKPGADHSNGAQAATRTGIRAGTWSSDRKRPPE